jgi:hypothetical protein
LRKRKRSTWKCPLIRCIIWIHKNHLRPLYFPKSRKKSLSHIIINSSIKCQHSNLFHSKIFTGHYFFLENNRLKKEYLKRLSTAKQLLGYETYFEREYWNITEMQTNLPFILSNNKITTIQHSLLTNSQTIFLRWKEKANWKNVVFYTSLKQIRQKIRLLEQFDCSYFIVEYLSIKQYHLIIISDIFYYTS